LNRPKALHAHGERAEEPEARQEQRAAAGVRRAHAHLPAAGHRVGGRGRVAARGARHPGGAAGGRAAGGGGARRLRQDARARPLRRQRPLARHRRPPRHPRGPLQPLVREWRGRHSGVRAQRLRPARDRTQLLGPAPVHDAARLCEQGHAKVGAKWKNLLRWQVFFFFKKFF